MKVSALIAGLGLAAVSALAGDGTIRRSPQSVPDQYIVVFDPAFAADISFAAADLSARHRGRLGHTFRHGVKGFSVQMSEARARALALDPRVKFVEQDSVVTASTAWGLDRINQRALPLDSNYVSTGTGAGVTVYVVDTGILKSHHDFGNRVVSGFSAISGGTEDCNGHGTHVAAIAGGSSYGVAKELILVPVRVLDCNGSGTLSGVLAGLDWVLKNHRSGTPGIVNMSLSGPRSSALDSAVNSLVGRNISCVVAAGNTNEDACNVSPARVPAAITVGATTVTDVRASFSNYGACVDLFAPGADILSAWHASTSSSTVLSGTSQAAPHAAGVAALYLQKNPGASPSAISQALLGSATTNVLSSIGAGSPNRFLYSELGGAGQIEPGSSQLVSDPGFESGELFWTSGICTILKPVGCVESKDVRSSSFQSSNFPSHGGSTHAGMGGEGTRHGEFLSQQVTLPPNASSVELSFYLRVITKERPASLDDFLLVSILSESGRLLETLSIYTNRDECPDYIPRRFDVSHHAGKTIQIFLAAIEDDGRPTWFLVDDLTLRAWR